MSPAHCGRQVRAWRASCVLVLLLVAPLATGQSAPPLPGDENGRQNDLAAVTRDWSVSQEDDGSFVRLLGEPRDEPSAGEVAYGIHADVAWIEGAFIPDPTAPSPAPLFNTGARLRSISFEPPLGLADGRSLSRIEPAALNWSADPVEQAPWPGAHYHTFTTKVPEPDPDGTTPPANDSATGEVLTLRWTIRVLSEPGETRRTEGDGGNVSLLHSTADAHLHYGVSIPREQLSPEGWSRLGGTAARLVFLFDFGGSATGRAVGPSAPADWDGVYLYRGDSAAALRFVQAPWVDVDVRASAVSGGQDPAGEPRTLQAPLFVNATVPGSRVREAETGNETGVFALQGAFGYLMDLPEPTASPSPTDRDEEDVPAGVLPILLPLVAFVLWLRRTEAAR